MRILINQHHLNPIDRVYFLFCHACVNYNRLSQDVVENYLLNLNIKIHNTRPGEGDFYF